MSRTARDMVELELRDLRSQHSEQAMEGRAIVQQIAGLQAELDEIHTNLDWYDGEMADLASKLEDDDLEREGAW